MLAWVPVLKMRRMQHLYKTMGKKTSEVTGFARVVKRKRVPYH